MPGDIVTPIPDSMDFATAAAFPVAYGTAHFALDHRGKLGPGETLLVLGAAGGVGLAAPQLGIGLQLFVLTLVLLFAMSAVAQAATPEDIYKDFAEDGKLLAPARVTVIHNGVVVQNGTEFMGPTRHRSTRRPWSSP